MAFNLMIKNIELFPNLGVVCSTVERYGPTWRSGQPAEYVTAAKRANFAATTGKITNTTYLILPRLKPN